MGHFFHELDEEEHEGTQRLLEMQNQPSGHTLSHDTQKPSQEEWGKTQDVMEASLLLEKNLKQSPWDLRGLSSAHTDSHLCGFLESHVLGEEVKLTQKMSDHLTNLCRLGKNLFQSLTHNHNSGALV